MTAYRQFEIDVLPAEFHIVAKGSTRQNPDEYGSDWLGLHTEANAMRRARAQSKPVRILDKYGITVIYLGVIFSLESFEREVYACYAHDLVGVAETYALMSFEQWVVGFRLDPAKGVGRYSVRQSTRDSLEDYVGARKARRA